MSQSRTEEAHKIVLTIVWSLQWECPVIFLGREKLYFHREAQKLEVNLQYAKRKLKYVRYLHQMSSIPMPDFCCL